MRIIVSLPIGLSKLDLINYFSIRGYGIVSLTDAILIIGGKCDDHVSISRIAKYKLSATIEEWSEVGNLQKPRDYHRATINGNRIYVVGGYNSNDHQSSL